jgi:hypothetical protein
VRHQGDTTIAAPPAIETRIGYTRVSTVSQTLDQQNPALEAAGVTKTFSDTRLDEARDLFDHGRGEEAFTWWLLEGG